MATPLNPQEIYLLERYSSPDYFADMRDAWAAMVRVAEQALDVFVHHLPSDYRNRPLFKQPDIVWGERVLVNFRNTLAGLDSGFIALTHGDMTALGWSGDVSSDAASFQRDYSSEWMSEPAVASEIPDAEDRFWEFLGLARKHALNIECTNHAWWTVGDLGDQYDGARGPLSPPTQWPTYRLDARTRVASAAAVPRTGIYLPDASDSAPAFMIEGHPAPQALIGYDPKRMQAVSSAPTVWTLVVRTADSGGGIPGAVDSVEAGIRLRVEAGQPCPRTGWWFTPAKAGSRRRFEQGTSMPAFESDYGATIWQWDENQQG